MSEQKKQSSRLLPLAIAFLAVGGGGAAYWFYTQRSADSGNLPVGANVIPQSALMTLSVSTAPDQWQKLREYGTPESQALVDQGLAQLRDRLLTTNGLNYEQDIQPWIGKEVTVAFVSPEASGTATKTPPALANNRKQAAMIVIPIANPLKAKQLLEKPNTFKGSKWTERSYKGFQIRETQTGAPQTYSTTVLDQRLLVLTTDAKVTEQAIDTFKGQPALATTPGYTKATDKIQAAQPFGKVYVNLPVASTLATANAAKSGSEKPSPSPSGQAQDNQGFAGMITLESVGMQFKGLSWLQPNSSNKYAVENTAKGMPSRLPSDTLMMVSGGNLQRLWQQYTQGASSNAIAPLNPALLRSGIQSTTGLDLEKDLLPWMSGEFSLALLPAVQTPPSNLPAGLVLMVQTSDRRSAEKSLKQLDQAMSSRYRFKVDEAKISDQPLTNWTLPFGGTLVSHGWLSGDVAFFTVGAPVASAILPKPTSALGESDLFRKAVASGSNPNNGYFFMNVDQMLSTNLALLPLTPTTKTLLGAIQTIGMTTAISDERSVRYDLLLTLRKGNPPAALPSPVK